jgi:hypothetical protein
LAVTTVVGGHKGFKLVEVETTLAPDVAELEARVVVAGVLIVDAPDLLPGFDEVLREQIVVARDSA